MKDLRPIRPVCRSTLVVSQRDNLCWHWLIAMSQPLLLTLLLSAVLFPATIAHGTKPMPPSQPASTLESDGYVLGAGDRVRVEFFSVPEFSGEYLVLPNGTINFPQAGAIVVQGKTLRQASDEIVARFTPYLTRPIVTLSLTVSRPITVVLAGEINRPGSYTIGNETVPNLTRTLQLAEGVTQAADLRRVQVRRRSTTPDQDEVLTVDLWQLLQAGNTRQDLRLRDGDSVYIPTATNVNLAEARQLANANFATRSTRPLKIAIVGEVSRPGPYTISDAGGGGSQGANQSQATSVTKAIQIAGGITQSADIRNIQVRRLSAGGVEQRIKIDFWQLLSAGDVLQDLPLQDGDTIEIPTATAMNDQEVTRIAVASFSPDRVAVNIVGEVERAGTVTVAPNTPLNQALLAAGGFNSRARKRSVTLVRLNPNGTVTKRDVSINFDQGVNEQNNPALRNNDTIIVRKSPLAGVTETLGAITAPFSGIFSFFRLFGL
ncbi:polysaccharide biosynthesis/export family protein [Phormidesmis sp. 146-20]